MNTNVVVFLVCAVCPSTLGAACGPPEPPPELDTTPSITLQVPDFIAGAVDVDADQNAVMDSPRFRRLERACGAGDAASCFEAAVLLEPMIRIESEGAIEAVLRLEDFDLPPVPAAPE